MQPTAVISNEKHKDVLLQGARDLWEDSVLFDFTLEVEDESIPVHRVILASCSGYFRSLFNSGMREIEQNSVSLDGLTADSVKTLVKFVYTGSLDLYLDSFEDVLLSAHYLQMPSAVDSCSDYMLDNLNWDNVLHRYRLAKLYSLDNVHRKVEHFMLKGLLDIPHDAVKSFGSQIAKLVGSNSLFVDSEYSLFEKLMSFQSLISDDEFYEALSKVRFPLMSCDELKIVSKSGVMTSRFKHLLDEAFEYHSDVVKQAGKQTERTQIRSDQVLIFLATEASFHGMHKNHPSITLESYDSPIVFKNSEVVVVDNYLYVCAQFCLTYNQNRSWFFRYDPRFDSWQELQYLRTKRETFPLVGYQDRIFAIGGKNTQTVEVYNIKSDDWQFCSDINYSNVASAGVALGNKIYVCGGHISEEHLCSDNLSCYDPQEDTWQFLAPMNKARHKHNVFALNRKMYVFGGAAGFGRSSMEYYNPDVDQWTLFHRDLFDIDTTSYFLAGSVVYRLDRKQDYFLSCVWLRFEEFDIETGKRTESFSRSIPFRAEEYEEPPPKMLSLILPSTCSRTLLTNIKPDRAKVESIEYSF